MNWKDLFRQLNSIQERHPELMNEPAMVKIGKGVFELDLYRSVSTGRLLIAEAYSQVSAVSTEDGVEYVPHNKSGEQE